MYQSFPVLVNCLLSPYIVQLDLRQHFFVCFGAKRKGPSFQVMVQRVTSSRAWIFAAPRHARSLIPMCSLIRSWSSIWNPASRDAVQKRRRGSGGPGGLGSRDILRYSRSRSVGTGGGRTNGCSHSNTSPGRGWSPSWRTFATPHISACTVRSQRFRWQRAPRLPPAPGPRREDPPAHTSSAQAWRCCTASGLFREWVEPLASSIFPDIRIQVGACWHMYIRMVCAQRHMRYVWGVRHMWDVCERCETHMCLSETVRVRKLY